MGTTFNVAFVGYYWVHPYIGLLIDEKAVVDNVHESIQVKSLMFIDESSLEPGNCVLATFEFSVSISLADENNLDPNGSMLSPNSTTVHDFQEEALQSKDTRS